jgi:hypothetical protein
VKKENKENTIDNKPVTYIDALRNRLRELSKMILDNKDKAFRLNIERRALKMYLNTFRHEANSMYAIHVIHTLDSNLATMERLAKEQRTLKRNHAVYSQALCRETDRKRNDGR